MSTQTQDFAQILFGTVPNLLDSQDNEEEGTVVSERSAITVKASNVNSDRLNTKQTMSGMRTAKESQNGDMNRFDNVEFWVSSLGIVQINALLGLYNGFGPDKLALVVQSYVPSFQSQIGSIQKVVNALEHRRRLLGDGRNEARPGRQHEGRAPRRNVFAEEIGSDSASLGHSAEEDSTGNNDGRSSACSSRCLGGETADAVISLAALLNPLPAAAAATQADDETSSDISSRNTNWKRRRNDEDKQLEASG
ncbi:hypothetical protein ACA910_002834 [Epithemia clementina (nom. ined.)]